MSVFDDLMAQLDKLPAREREALSRHVMTATASDIWIPNPGPQTEAYYCTADELYFGGSAGGGKSEIGLGLAFTAHAPSPTVPSRSSGTARDFAATSSNGTCPAG